MLINFTWNILFLVGCEPRTSVVRGNRTVSSAATTARFLTALASQTRLCSVDHCNWPVGKIIARVHPQLEFRLHFSINYDELKV